MRLVTVDFDGLRQAIADEMQDQNMMLGGDDAELIADEIVRRFVQRPGAES